MSKLGRRRFLVYSSATVATSMLLKACATGEETVNTEDGIKVGILHSLSGTMAISETTVVDAEMLAIDEINAAGGILGKKIIPVKEDGASDWPHICGESSQTY